MNRLGEKGVLMLLCLVCLGMSESATAAAVSMITALTVSSAVVLFDKHPISYVLIAGVSLLCIPFPILFCITPLMLYDSMWLSKPYLVLPALCSLFKAGSFTAVQLMTVGVGILTALVLYRRVSSLEKTVASLSAMRDEAVDKNENLFEKNIRLLEAQDNEVRLATLGERNRIAREIHDNVGHLLTRSLLQAGALGIINKDEDLKEPIDELKETLNTAMTSIRQSVHDLHDDSIDFDANVRSCISSVGDRFKITYENDCGELPVKIRLCFLAVIKEALSNSVKHSNGDSISISVREHPAFYRLAVDDNGSCDESTVRASDGIGLQNMRDRAVSLGGILTVTPSKDGFRIFMTVPKTDNNTPNRK